MFMTLSSCSSLLRVYFVMFSCKQLLITYKLTYTIYLCPKLNVLLSNIPEETV